MQESSRIEVHKSLIPTAVATGVVVAVSGFLFTVTSSLLSAIDDLIPLETTRLTNLVRVIALIIAIVAIIVTWMQDRGKKYYIENESLIVQNNRKGGSMSQKVLSIRNIQEIDTHQSVLGKMCGYGSVRIGVHMGALKEQVELKNIDEPKKIVAELKSRLQ